MAKEKKKTPPKFSMARPGQYMPNRTITDKVKKDLKPVKMERTGRNTGRVHMEDGGFAEFTVDDPKKFSQFNMNPKSMGAPKSTGTPNLRKNPDTGKWERYMGSGGWVEVPDDVKPGPSIMSNEDRFNRDFPLDDSQPDYEFWNKKLIEKKAEEAKTEEE